MHTLTPCGLDLEDPFSLPEANHLEIRHGHSSCVGDSEKVNCKSRKLGGGKLHKDKAESQRVAGMMIRTTSHRDCKSKGLKLRLGSGSPPPEACL